MKFRKKPVVIEAIQWLASKDSFDEVAAFVGSNGWAPGEMGSDTIIIRTLEGDMKANKFDWIIKGVSGEFYPCKPDIFEKTYEPAE